ncbi:hypothetical protein HA051_15260 [Chromobacterium vaccinii]|nr:hypothetical protein [Chromobacterium vaccinii]
MKYPSWADPFIVAHADRCILADRLSRGDYAEAFWGMLRRHDEFRNGYDGIHPSAEFDYYINIKLIIKDVSNLPNVPPGVIKGRANKVAELARKLAWALEETVETLGGAGRVPEAIGLDEYAVSTLKNNVQLFEIENNTLIRGMVLGNIKHYSSEASPRRVMREAKQVLRAHYLKEHQARLPLVELWKERWGITEEQWSDEAFQPPAEADSDFPQEIRLEMGREQVVAKIIDNVSNLSLVKVLYQLAKELDEYENGIFLVNKPKVDGVLSKALMREVHEYHLLRFGQPLNDAIALLLTIGLSLDEPLTKSDIRI